MGEVTGIEWTDHTFNPWFGCTAVSAGCRHCYAEQLMDTRLGKVRWGKGKPRVRTSPANWRLPLKWNAAAIAAGESRRVFCASLADVFDCEVDPSWRDDLWALIRATPALDWQLVTKRPDFMAAEVMRLKLPENVWLGVSVEDQDAADERIPWLLTCNPVVRFLSVEPLLGPVDLSPWMIYADTIHWVIVGGESGPKARPIEVDWVGRLWADCAAGNVDFFFKQWGGVDKKANGRQFKARTHDAIPARRAVAA